MEMLDTGSTWIIQYQESSNQHLNLLPIRLKIGKVADNVIKPKVGLTIRLQVFQKF